VRGKFNHAGKTTVRLSVQKLTSQAAPADLLLELAKLPQPVLLESAAQHPNWGRYSLAGCCPLEVISLQDGRLVDSAGEQWAYSNERSPDLPADKNLWAALDQAMSAVVPHNPPPKELPYLPGWIGYIGYGLNRYIDRLPGKAVGDICIPDLRLGFYDAILIYDHLERSWSLVELLDNGTGFTPGPAAAMLREALSGSAVADQPKDACELPPPDQFDPLLSARSNLSPERYMGIVQRCLDYISAGDIFQANLSQRFTIDGIDDHLAAYRALRRCNPAWYSAYLPFDWAGRRYTVLSTSPELFLRCRNGVVTTRPIKGTLRREGDDDQSGRQLLSSVKDNAELAMIVDLLRNDLGRVCRFGTVRVPQPKCLEIHPSVYHLVATVVGTLRPGVGPAELLRATFPGGSITGAPKIRAMEIIDELEPQARGIYTGCIGIVGIDGRCEWNIAIRTVVCEESRAFVQVGGGIVADSQPQAEYNETIDKARTILQALSQVKRADKITARAGPSSRADGSDPLPTCNTKK